MKPENQPAERLFEAARQLVTREERSAFLEIACRGDPHLRDRVEALLRADQQAGTFLEEPLATVSIGITPGMEALPSLAAKPAERIGRYKLLQQIGEGGCGVVYMAEQEEPVRRRVALKIIKLGMDTKQVVGRFEAERQALALMDHPNIAKVLDAGATETGRPFFVMELVRGIRLTDYCDQNNLSTEERLKLFIQVCQAVQHAHQKGIIHRDIKPSNILVTGHDGVPVPKVIDFGIAKATTDQRLTDKTLYTAFEQFIGTPAYMSPEQAEMRGLDVDTRTDIYSLGVLLYELLTGNPPFAPTSLLEAGLDEMRRIIREQEPPRPSTRLTTLDDADLRAVAAHRRAEVPKLINLIRGDLDWIVMQAMEKDRARRYETANGLAQDLMHYLKCEPVVARPPSAVYKFQKFARRNVLALAAATIVATVIIAALGLSLWSLTRERKARENETGMRRQAEASEQKAQTERKRADAQAGEVRLALAASDLHQAVQFIAEGKDNYALAHLVRSLKNNPTNQFAAMRLAILLASMSWPMPSLTLTHSGFVHFAEFSPSGRSIVTVPDDGTARLWDAQTGQPLTNPLTHQDVVLSARFSPDGKRVVTSSDDGTARVWDAQTGQPLTKSLTHERPDGESRVESARFSPDGKRVVTASRDGTARIWDAQTGQQLTRPLQHEAAVFSAQFSPDGKRVVTASQDFSGRVWDTESGQPLTPPLNHSAIVMSAEFSPDGKRVLSSAGDGTVWVWDVQTGKLLAKSFAQPGESPETRFSPDGWLAVTFSTDHSARLWDLQTLQPLSARLSHRDQIVDAQFSPDGKWVVTASSDNTAQVWDTQTGQPMNKPLKHREPVRSAQFSPNGMKVVTASRDTTARVWVLTPPPNIDPVWLISLAEALSPERLNSVNVLEASKISQAKAVLEVRKLLIREPENGDWAPWGRWVVAKPLERTISPFSSTTIREYIERELPEATPEDLQDAALMASEDEGLRQRIAAARQRLDQLEQADTLQERANRLAFAGILPEAEALCREALALRKRHLGNEHSQVGETLCLLAQVLRQEGNLTEAETHYRKALEAFKAHPPSNPNVLTDTVASLDSLLRGQGKVAEAEVIYEGILNVASEDCLNDLAWRLATSKCPETRNGKIAVLLAEKAVALGDQKKPRKLDTLAAAYAEIGDFDAAVKFQKEAMALPTTENKAKKLAGRLKLYEARTSYRQPDENCL